MPNGQLQSTPLSAPVGPQPAPAVAATVDLREEIERSLNSGATVLGELYHSCEDADSGALTRDFHLWKENPAVGIQVLTDFLATLDAPEKAHQKAAMEAMLAKIEAYTPEQQKEYFAVLAERLGSHRQEVQGARDARERLRRSTESRAAENIFENLKEGVMDNPVPTLIVGAAALWFLASRKDNPVVKAGIYSALGLGTWFAASHISEDAGYGDLGINASLEAVQRLFGKDGEAERVSYRDAAERLPFTGEAKEFADISAAFFDVPTPKMIELYYSARQDNGLKIDFDNPALRDSLPRMSPRDREKYARAMYSALDQLFGGRFVSPHGVEYDYGALAALYQNSELPFGSFLLTMTLEESRGMVDAVRDSLTSFRSGAVSVLEHGIVSGAILVGEVVKTGWYIPFETGGRLLGRAFATENPDGSLTWFWEDQEFIDLDALIAAVTPNP